MSWVFFALNLGSGPGSLLSQAFILEGSQTSYAQFRQWDGSAANSSLELEFRTSQPDGLLLYTDNKEAREYMLLKVVSGSGVSLRFNWGEGAQVVTVPGQFNDTNWHKVRSLLETNSKHFMSTYVAVGHCY